MGYVLSAHFFRGLRLNQSQCRILRYAVHPVPTMRLKTVFQVFMFGWTMFMLCRKCAPSKTSKKSVAIACVLLILSTAVSVSVDLFSESWMTLPLKHVTCNTKRVVTAYGSEHGNSAGDPAAFLTRLVFEKAPLPHSSYVFLYTD
jgi:hypothetical protein